MCGIAAMRGELCVIVAMRAGLCVIVGKRDELPVISAMRTSGCLSSPSEGRNGIRLVDVGTYLELVTRAMRDSSGSSVTVVRAGPCSKSVVSEVRVHITSEGEVNEKGLCEMVYRCDMETGGPKSWCEGKGWRP